jgi:hypothetical protein
MMIRDFIGRWRTRFTGAAFAEFAAAAPSPVIVWEPGPWLPRGSGETVRAPSTNPPVVGAAAQPIVIPLPFTAATPRLTLGRDPANAIFINDGSLSRSHLEFLLQVDGALEIQDLGSSNGSWLEGVRLDPGVPTATPNGARIKAGGIYLTYLDVRGIYDRLQPSVGPAPVR